ncbi:MAG: ABC transporter substrate-binding protein [Thermoanaerobaculaceae bacterium]|nr:ABC transporter substrate-binding protein [Thermoanaerobaculaceae bacterium]
MSMRGRGLAFGAVLTAAALTLTACGGDSDDTAADPAGGTVNIFGSQPQNPLVPVLTNETGGGNVIDNLFTRLVDYNPETAAPELAMAESIEPSEGNTLWTIKLKPGWKFHDGTPVTAESFVKAWNDGANCNTGALNQYFFGPDGVNIKGYDAVAGTYDAEGNLDCAGIEPDAGMEGLKVVDDTTFTAELAGPVSIFATIVGYSAFAPMPEIYFTDRPAFEAKPIGNGPYQFVSAKANESIVVTEYPDYQGEKKAQVKDINYKIYQTPDAAYVDLLANNLDVIDTMPATALAGDRWKTELGDRSILKPVGVFQSVTFPLYVEEFDNPELRKAISMAIDRESVISVAFNNTRTPADGWVPPVIEGYQPGACGEACTFDAAKAKQMFDDAGGFDGTLTIAYNADGGHKEWVDATCVSIKNALDVECQGKAYPTFAELRNDVTEDKMTGIFRTGWQMDYPSMQNFLAPLYATDAGSNDGGYSNPAFDTLLRDAAGQTPEEAIASYQQATQLLAEDMPVIPLWYGALTAGWSENIETPVFTPFGRVDWTSLKLKG